MKDNRVCLEVRKSTEERKKWETVWKEKEMRNRIDLILYLKQEKKEKNIREGNVFQL